MNIKFKPSIKKTNYIIIVAIIISIIASYYIVKNNIIRDYEKDKAVELKQDVNEIVIESKSDYMDIPSLLSINPDTVGYIKINDTLVDYPLVKSTNNDFYLDKSFKQESNLEGTIFMDYKNTADFNDKNTILYGHNMSGDTMFGGLRFYRDQSYKDSHPIIKIYTPSLVLEYEVFSVYVTEPNYDYRTKEFNNDKEFEDFLTRVKTPSIITSNITPKITDKILTLSTCAFDFEDARLAIHAILLNTKENKK
ncbi:MAG: class B sortase [Clostridium sp.]